MKILVFIFLLCLLCINVAAQYRLIGTIDFYGAKTISEQQLREALQIKERDAPPPSSEKVRQIIKRLTALPNVEQADVSTICCTPNNKLMLYVGIREKDSPTLKLRADPKGEIRLTDEIVKTGEAFDKAHYTAVLKGDSAEDDSQGHSLMINAEARAVQKKFILIAAKDLDLLRRVLRESSDASHRAYAAEIIAYAADKKSIVEDLVYAVNDSESAVRNNAMRALGLIAGYARNTPEKRISVPFAPLVDMLNSIEWTDRNKASLALMKLTEKRDAKLLEELRQHALPSLFNMARWKDKGHSSAGFIILGRIGNLPEDEIMQAAMSGNREDLLAKLQKSLQPKP